MTTAPSSQRATEPESAPAARLRRNRDFVLLWVGAAATALGVRVSGIAYPLLVIWTTGSASSAGLVGFAALLPNLLVQMHAGALVDRFDRRRLMILCDLGSLLATGAVATAVVTGHVWIWLLMAATFVQGSLAIFYRLAERAGVRHLVPAAQLPTALSANEARTQAAGLLGQPGGSVLYAVARSAPFLLATAAHAVSLFSLLLIRGKFQDERPQRQGNIGAELREGLSWTWKQRFLRSGMLLLSGSNLLFQVLSLALILIIKEHGSSAAVVGVITAVSGLGGMFGALTGSWWIRRVSLRTLLIGGSVGWALLMPLVGLTGNPLLLGLVFLGAALIGSVTNVAGGIYQVAVTPDRLQGRVGAAMGLIATGASSLGTFAGGFALQRFGTGATVSGVACVMGLIALSSFLLPAAALPEQTGSGARTEETEATEATSPACAEDSPAPVPNDD